MEGETNLIEGIRISLLYRCVVYVCTDLWTKVYPPFATPNLYRMLMTSTALLSFVSPTP